MAAHTTEPIDIFHRYYKRERVKKMKNIIETESLSKRFGSVVAVDRVDLEVPEAAIYAFLGPNGAGKTTTIRLLLGLTRPDAGKVSLFGEFQPGRKRSAASEIGSLVEGPSLYPHLNAEEMLRMAAGLLKMAKPQPRIDELLSLLNLQKARKRLIKTWSMGMKQRLGLALAMLNRPRLLILDEPTNGLDPAGIQEMRALLRDLPLNHGMTVFLSSHLLDEVNRVATHVGIIKEGRLIFQGAIAELQRQSPGGLLIRCSDNQRGIQLARQRGYTAVEREEGFMLPDLHDDGQAAALNSAMVEAGMDVYHMAHHTAGLEELFNELTNEGASA